MPPSPDSHQALPGMADDERRREPRHPIRQRIFLRARGIPVGRVWLVDLSTRGCCLQGEGLDLAVGQHLSLHRGAGNDYLASGHTGTVRWTSADMAGMQFDQVIRSNDTLWQGLIALCGGPFEIPALRFGSE